MWTNELQGQRDLRRISRRSLLRQTACGFGALGLAGLCTDAGALYGAAGTGDPVAPKTPHFAPRAKRVIFLFMHGGPSHLDTFDPKPRLDRDHGKPIPFQRGLTFADLSSTGIGGLMKSPFEFKQYGQSGIPVSSLFPHVAKHVDDLCVIRSMVGDGVDHGGALLQLHTGTISFTRPSMGSWCFMVLVPRTKTCRGSSRSSLPWATAGKTGARPSFPDRIRGRASVTAASRPLAGNRALGEREAEFRRACIATNWR